MTDLDRRSFIAAGAAASVMPLRAKNTSLRANLADPARRAFVPSIVFTINDTIEGDLLVMEHSRV